MLSNDSIALLCEKVNREISIISDKEIDINIFEIIFNILDELNLNDQLEVIKEIYKLILAQKRRKHKYKKHKKYY